MRVGRGLYALPGAGLLPIAKYSEDLESFVTTNYAAVLMRDAPEVHGER